MKNLLSIGIAFLVISSCTEKEPKIVLTDYYVDGKIESTIELNKDSILDGRMITYYPNGNIETNSFWVMGKIEGELIRYFESGQIMSIENYSNHKMHGHQVGFYKNGRKKFILNYYHGLMAGIQYEFHNNESNSISIESYWYIHGNKSRANYTTEYSGNGNILYASPYADLKLLDDEIEIRLQRPKYKNMLVILGDYDYRFILRDTTSIDTIVSENDFIVKLKYSKRDTIRGYIENWEDFTDSTGASQFIHFSYPDKWK